MGNLLVYKASAGSGKTYSLAQEYIKLAIQSGSPTSYRNILAVTFTNKATCEMKDRILLQLFNLAHGGLDEGFLCNLLEKLNAPYNEWRKETEKDGSGSIPVADGTDPDSQPPHFFTRKEVCQRAGQVLHHIIHDYDHFRVETIDSFFQSLLTNLTHELKLPRAFHIDLNDDDVICRAVDRLMLLLTGPDATKQMADTLRTVMGYIDEQIENEKGWNIDRALKAFAKNNLRNAVYRKYAKQFTEFQPDEASHTNPKEEALARTKKKEAIAHLKKFAREEEIRRKEQIKKAAADVLDFYEDMGPDKLSRSGNIMSFAKKVEEGNIFPTSHAAFDKALASPEYLMRKADLLKPEVRDRAEAVCRLLQVLKREQDDYGLIVLTAILTVQNVGLVSLLDKIEHLITDINSETNHFMLSRTAELFSELVKPEDAPIVFERTGTTFKHIMIDEFQDTSRMQWDNFHKLLVENLANNNQCMIVGDIKQSIYRWRDGDWQILDTVMDDPAFHSRKQVPLDTNYRSQEAIVSFNNEFFPKAAEALDGLMPEAADIPKEWHGRIRRIYSDEDTKQKCKKKAEGGWVRLAVAESKDVSFEDVMEDLYRQIRHLKDEANVPFGKMGILVRFNPDGANIINYFSEHHPDIKMTSDVAFELKSSAGVMTLIYALQYLHDSSDKLALAELLKSIGAKSPDRNCFNGSFPTDFHTILKNAESVLPSELTSHEGRSQLLLMPLYELCQHLIELLGLTLPSDSAADTENADKDSAYLFYFMDAVLEFLADNPSDLGLFLEHWDASLSKCSTTGSIGESVHVITIHKSKGLDFHTVLMPLTNWNTEKFRNNDIIWCETPPEAPFNALPVAAVNASSSSVMQSYYKTNKLSEMLQMRIDNINLLYVAFTRAKENMLIWSLSTGAEKTISKASTLITQIAPPLLSPEQQENQPGNAESEGAEAAAFRVYTSGHLRQQSPESLKKKEEQAPQVKNPLDNPNPREYAICMESVSQKRIAFKQSNPAKDFLADALAGTSDADTANRNIYIDKGKLLHQLFQHIGCTADLQPALHTLLTEGVIPSVAEANKMGHEVEQHMKAEKVRKLVSEWFDGSWQLFNECDILYRDKGILKSRRPDRVMVKDGQTIVLDYKFGQKKEKRHHNQVGEYIHFMHSMGHNNVRGYLWYVTEDEVLEVDESGNLIQG